MNPKFTDKKIKDSFEQLFKEPLILHSYGFFAGEGNSDFETLDSDTEVDLDSNSIIYRPWERS